MMGAIRTERLRAETRRADGNLPASWLSDVHRTSSGYVGSRGQSPERADGEGVCCDSAVTRAEHLPLLAAKAYALPSVFEPANLLRESRRQRGLPAVAVPSVCVLDPDGDIVRHLESTGRATRHPGWACYHTQMWVTTLDGIELGVVGLAVGAPFAVMVAEQLAASGCDLLVSITSAGQITSGVAPPYLVLIDRALRDEGTSAHYVAPRRWSALAGDLADRLRGGFGDLGEPVRVGSSWTTDAPYRETTVAVAAARAEGIACVEMEAAALYAYAEATGAKVVCLAHVTNTMGTTGDDFDKGAGNGVDVVLAAVRAVVLALP